MSSIPASSPECKTCLLVPLPNHIIPVHDLQDLFSKIHSNVRPSTFRSFKWFLEFRFSHQHPVSISFLLHTCHMPSPISSSLLLSPEYGLERTTDHEAPHCADFPSLPLQPPLTPKHVPPLSKESVKVLGQVSQFVTR